MPHSYFFLMWLLKIKLKASCSQRKRCMHGFFSSVLNFHLKEKLLLFPSSHILTLGILIKFLRQNLRFWMGGQSTYYPGSKKWCIFHSESEFYILIHIVMLLTNITMRVLCLPCQYIRSRTPRFILMSPFLS